MTAAGTVCSSHPEAVVRSSSVVRREREAASALPKEAQDAAVLPLMRRLVDARPTYGYRRREAC